MAFLGIFASDNERALKQVEKTAQKIEALSDKYKAMNDTELRAVTPALKARLEAGETLNDILPDAFAAIREASVRVINQRPFHSQVVGGIVLHQGRIAEMKTGEGKTLVATLPAYLNALAGKGVHVVTVNEYLAGLAAEWMGKIFKFMGLSVGCSFSQMDPMQKRDAYACDITYVTNSELGFDYLRDNMAQKAQDRMQRGFSFAIVDEVDSILIDEARTPLIISGRGFKSSDTYTKVQRFIKTLKRDTDYKVDEEKKAIHLTEDGQERAEQHFGVESLSDMNAMELNQHIMNALRANYMMRRESDYIVKDGEVLLVDEFTGRIMDGRRYSDGLHQAIEAKEGVQVKDELLTVASITLQNYFRMYKKLSGMTGTAKTEEGEFNKIYGLDVVSIPTNLPMIRVDEPDIVYVNTAGKLKAIVNRIEEAHTIGQPVLVGTTTIEKSEEISKMLKQKKIPHHVLNAKYHEQEAEIVAQAGRHGAVTIATNMAGRGTDILLGGNPDFLAKQSMIKSGYNHAQIELASSYHIEAATDETRKAKTDFGSAIKKFSSETQEEKKRVVEAGGLLIIGTERHESRRIDNQLRGRAGRQGDPGRSVFYISLEDDLIRLFGGDRLKSISGFFRLDEDTPFQIKMLSKQIENAQKKVEANHYGMRRRLIEYDDVMNKQRSLIYEQRNKILDGHDVHSEIVDMFPDIVRETIYKAIDTDKPSFEWNLDEINDTLEDKIFKKGTRFITEKDIEDTDEHELVDKILDYINTQYETKIKEVEELGIKHDMIERFILLSNVDRAWMEHIDAMTTLRREIGTLAHGNQDPIVAYKREAFSKFDEMIAKIRENTATVLLNLEKPTVTVTPAAPRPPMQNLQTGTETMRGETPRVAKGPAKSDKLTGRNSPCPCGSGKKYKNCCG
ncbi:MAG: preprotein translocase subunit SecA [Firmicutes bacterium]|nr:preprotein translocase subunit SecA [Bacillota bacterium]